MDHKRDVPSSIAHTMQGAWQPRFWHGHALWLRGAVHNVVWRPLGIKCRPGGSCLCCSIGVGSKDMCSTWRIGARHSCDCAGELAGHVWGSIERCGVDVLGVADYEHTRLFTMLTCISSALASANLSDPQPPACRAPALGLPTAPGMPPPTPGQCQPQLRAPAMVCTGVA